MKVAGTISASEALQLLKRGRAVVAVTVTGRVDATSEHFAHAVVLRDADLSADFKFAWFPDGFLAERCRFRGRLDFREGGHNDRGTFALRECVFEGPVDFDDCLFTGPFEAVNCQFEGGTNLLRPGWQEADQFRLDPEIRGNEGLLNLYDV